MQQVPPPKWWIRLNTYNLPLGLPLLSLWKNQNDQDIKITNNINYSKITMILQHVALDESLTLMEKKKLYVRKNKT